MPASGRWFYARNPKSGTNTMLAALFRIEFGAELTVGVSDTANTSAETATRHLSDAGALMDVSRTYTAPAALSEGLRIATVREPLDRALSAFAYLQQSHLAETKQFARLRIRLNAAYRFDWDRHPGTADGFERFLSFVRDLSRTRRFPIDRHIMPQSISIRPDFFAPQRIGRTDNMGPFLARLSEELGRPLPKSNTDLTRNTGQVRKARFEITPNAKRLCQEIYAADYDLYERATDAS